jgi:hypothetical protein
MSRPANGRYEIASRVTCRCVASPSDLPAISPRVLLDLHQDTTDFTKRDHHDPCTNRREAFLPSVGLHRRNEYHDTETDREHPDNLFSRFSGVAYLLTSTGVIVSSL